VTAQNVFVVGLMESGKTTLGRRLADARGWPLIDSDEQLAQRTGMTAAELAARDGIDALHALEADVLLEALAADEPAVVTAAASTIEDARCRAALADAHVVWIRAEPELLATRARAQSHRPLAHDVLAEFRAQAARRDPLFASVADETYDAGDTP
jgi:shikimate kinase